MARSCTARLVGSPLRPEHRRRAGLQTVLAIVAVGAICAGALAQPSPHTTAPTAATAGAMALADDDRGDALFDVSNLAPGRTVVRCLGVSYTGAGPADIRLTAAASSKPLAASLRLRVEAGRGGGFGDCTGFQGEPVFAGTLAELAGRHVDYQTGVRALESEPGKPATLRFSAWLGRRAPQGEAATMRFSLEARPAHDAGGSGGGVPDVTVAGAVPDTARPPEGAAAQVGRVERPQPRERSAGRGRDSTGPAARGDRDSGRAAGRSAPPDRHGHGAAAPPERSLLRGLADGVVKAATAVAKRSPFPLALLLLAIVYLGLQDRIDRRDPKLALAAVYADPELPFLDPPEPSR